MIRNYIKVALRYLLRYKQYTAINITGLAVGIASCVLIMLFVRSELSYDRFNKKADRTYRAWTHEYYGENEDFVNVSTPLPLASALQSSVPEVESTCRVYEFSALTRVGQHSFNENITMVDSTLFNIFDFELYEGNPSHPFPNNNSIILTEITAKKFFGNDSPMGKNLEVKIGDEEILMTVAGIAKNPPSESSIRFNMLIPFTNDRLIFRPRVLTSWFNVFPETYVLLREDVLVADLSPKFDSMLKQQLGEDYKEVTYTVHLQPLLKIHLDNTLPAGVQPTSNPKYSYILGTIGILILLLACINFITLSIGRSTTRAMEVGVRKVLGADRPQLIRQFWGEAMLVTFFSVIIGLGLALLLLGPFNQLIERSLQFHADGFFFVFLFLMIVAIGLIAGIYPAVILSRFNPIEILKGKLRITDSTGLLRKVLTVGQFVTSIAMIICTVVVSRQLNYIQNKDLGFTEDHVIVVPTNRGMKEGAELGELYRSALLKHPEVANASVDIFSLAEIPWAGLGYTDDKGMYREFRFNVVDHHFIETMNIQLVAGRNFDVNNSSDLQTAMLVNESLVKEYGWADPIGKKLPGKFNTQVIGVMKDFNYESLHNPVLPLILALTPDSIMRGSENVNYAYAPQTRVSVRLREGSLISQVELLKSTWKTVAPNQEFEYHFLDETLSRQYSQERRTSVLVQWAAALSIFIACMGLFGLATLTISRRTKEIGIRKVLGANVSNIVSMLSRDFLILVLIASAIAFPIAWYAMNTWLKDFAYRIPVSWWMFGVSAFAAIIIALLTISLQAINAAVANPVKALRTE